MQLIVAIVRIGKDEVFYTIHNRNDRFLPGCHALLHLAGEVDQHGIAGAGILTIAIAAIYLGGGRK